MTTDLLYSIVFASFGLVATVTVLVGIKQIKYLTGKEKGKKVENKVASPELQHS